MLILVASCATSGGYGERVRSGLLELSAHELKQCLGAPPVLHLQGSYEWAVYTHTDVKELAFRDIELGLAGHSIPASSRTGPSYCQYGFTFAEGRVRSVEVRGRYGSGLKADLPCMVRLRRCLPPKGR